MKIFDTHVHTNYAYCADDDMMPKSTIAIAKESGYGVCLVEHAGQLYVSEDDYWSGRFVEEPGLIFEQEYNRMDEYIEMIKGFRRGGVKIGIETEVDKNGALTLRDEHKNGWDIVIGAVHCLPQRFGADYNAGFLWAVQALAKNSIDILAHPFRYFLRRGQSVPECLYEPTAELLKDNGIAAELNFHTNEPDIKFFEMCANRGVKISLGSDAHSLNEVCDMQRHLTMMRSICGENNINDVLYRV